MVAYVVRVAVIATWLVLAACTTAQPRRDPEPTREPAVAVPTAPRVAEEAPPFEDGADGGFSQMPDPPSSTGECSGSAPRDLQDAIRRRAADVRPCYERALREQPTLEGRLVVAVRIDSQGTVASVSVRENELADIEVAACIEKLFTIAFPVGANGNCVDVHLPIRFAPKKNADAGP